ncbi:MAG TPA: cystathionine gamma-synthase [Candidatus Limnocylindria bacterium]|nr:cystathionine gamma-synthase [Candidatus Limnocylindria bacterium]
MTDDFETLVVHAGWEPDPATGAVVPPIQMSTTFKQDAVGQTRAGYEYGRSDNPTRRSLEAAIAALEGAKHGFAYASGLAATQNVLYLTEPAQRVVMCDDVYGGTWRLAAKVWSRYGVRVDPADVTSPDAVRAALSPEAVREHGPVALVWIETPTNPLLKVADIRAVVEIAHAAGALAVVDNTFATPYLQQPLAVGADIVLHSATKYLGGHSDVVGGLLATNHDGLAERLRFHQNAAGAVPSPFDCWLVLRGLRTLAVRMERACANATAIAYWLDGRPEVRRVYYPGLHDNPQRELCATQMRLPGAMVSFELDADDEAARRFVACTRLFTLAESLGAVESLIELPAAMTHLSVADSPLAVPPGLVRLSVGIESSNDLIADLEAAFAGAGISAG